MYISIRRCDFSLFLDANQWTLEIAFIAAIAYMLQMVSP